MDGRLDTDIRTAFSCYDSHQHFWDEWLELLPHPQIYKDSIQTQKGFLSWAHTKSEEESNHRQERPDPFTSQKNYGALTITRLHIYIYCPLVPYQQSVIMSEEGEQQQQQQQEEQPPSPQQEDSMVATTNSSIRTATVDMSTLPLQWTQMGVPVKKKKNTDDNDNAQDEDDDEEEEEATPKIRFPHDVAEISPDDLEITVVGTAGQKITHLPIDFSNMCHSELRSLVLRSHLISKMKGFDKFTSMELLELYDNQVQELESLEGPGPSLRVLDMSYNAIRDMSPVAICTNLQELCTNKYLHFMCILFFVCAHLELLTLFSHCGMMDFVCTYHRSCQ